ncbi:MAG: hypothetical protein V3S51_06705 [Dehalococcoidia bacterium]
MQEPSELDKAIGRAIRDLANWEYARQLPMPGTESTPEKKPDPDLQERLQWLNVIRHPSIILILGARGSGKSAAGYKFLEYSGPATDP